MVTMKSSTTRFKIERLEERIAPAWWGHGHHGHHGRGFDIDLRVNVNTSITNNITVSQIAFSDVAIGVNNNVSVGFRP